MANLKKPARCSRPRLVIGILQTLMSTIETGFSARAGGQRFNSGSFYSDGSHGCWWCSREPSQSSAWYRTMGSMHGDVGRSWGDNKKQGFSVRCLFDKFSYPTVVFVVLLAVGDEDVVIISFDYA